jgi:hypothetical protein
MGCGWNYLRTSSGYDISSAEPSGSTIRLKIYQAIYIYILLDYGTCMGLELK